MALIEVDVVGLQPGQGGVDLFVDLDGGQSLVGVAHRHIDLGGQDVGVSRPANQQIPQHRLRRPPAIGVGGVDEIDPKIEGRVDTGRCAIAFHANAVGEPGA